MLDIIIVPEIQRNGTDLARLTDKELLAWLRDKSQFADWLTTSAETFSRHLSKARTSLNLCSKRATLRHSDPGLRVHGPRVTGVRRVSRRRRCVGPPHAGELRLRASVERTPLFSPRENAIAKEPGSS
jgi:hypothetical protein